MISLAQREFGIATPEGKLRIAKKLQEDMVRLVSRLGCVAATVQFFFSFQSSGFGLETVSKGCAAQCGAARKVYSR